MGMKSAIGAVVAALCLIAAPSTASARGPYGSINVGNWKGGAYTNDQSGAFSHCAAGAQYESGIYFVVTINDKAGWTLGFAHEKWTFKTDQAFPIALTFDGQAPFNVHGVPLADKLLQVPMPDNSSLIAQFRKAKGMTAYTQGHLFQFKLDQTAQLLANPGELRRQGEAIRHRRRRGFFRGACGAKAGGRNGGAAGRRTGQA